MRKFLTALMVTLALSGCSMTSPPPESASSNAEYLDAVREVSPDLNAVSDEMLLDNAELVCEAFDQGWSVGRLLRTFLKYNLGEDTTTTLIAAAVIFKCPEHKDVIGVNDGA